MTEGLAHLGYPIFTPDGNERPLWEVGDDQPTVTEKLVLAHVSLGSLGSYSNLTWLCLSLLTSL